jgi:hypothetical protein
MLSGSVSDPDGDSVSCRFDADSCVTLGLTTTLPPSPTTTAITIGCNAGEVRLVCVDSRGAVGSTSWNVHN